MTTIYVIRHGEAENNIFRRMCGWYNARLTPLGEQQAQKLARRFESVPLDRVYYSDLARARRTSEPVAASHGLAGIPEKGLRELNTGVTENMDFATMGRLFPDSCLRFTTDPANCRIPGMEPHAATQKRMMDTVLRLAAENDGKTIALFSHGGAIRALTAAILGLPSERIMEHSFPGNTAVMLLEAEDGKLRMVYDNDSSHLGPEDRHSTKPAWQLMPDGSDRYDLREIRPEKDDLALIRRCWPDAPEALERLDPKDIVLECRDDERTGFAVMDNDAYAGESAGLLKYLYLQPGWRRQFVVPQYIGSCVNRARELGYRWLYAAAEPGSHIDGVLRHLGFAEKERLADGRTLLQFNIELEPLDE